MDIKFLSVKEEDLKEIKEIYQYYIDNSTATFHIGEIADNDIREMFFSGDDMYEGFKAVKDNEIVGYIYLSPYKKRAAYRRSAEVTLYFKQNVVGSGIGTKALKYIENVAKEKGIQVLLSVICGENNASINLFEKNGYEKAAHLKGVGEKFGRVLDIVMYQKDII